MPGTEGQNNDGPEGTGNPTNLGDTPHADAVIDEDAVKRPGPVTKNPGKFDKNDKREGQVQLGNSYEVWKNGPASRAAILHDGIDPLSQQFSISASTYPLTPSSSDQANDGGGVLWQHPQRPDW